MNPSRNPLTGYGCSGFRAMFRVHSIDPHTLFIPIEMKSLPQIRQLMQGVSPIQVFNTPSMSEARKAFQALRKKYDFDYWAIKEYFIQDIQNPNSIIPLRLNDAQHHVIDIIRKRYTQKKVGRYVISKSVRRCGLTTCIHAYTLWMQNCQCRNNSFFCAPSEASILPLKRNLCRHLHRDIVPQDPWLFLPKVDGRAFFFTFRNPDAIRGINLGYVHLANMAHWKDQLNNYSYRVRQASVSAVLLDYFTLVVIEGDVPSKHSFSIKKYLSDHPHDSERSRIKKLSSSFSNPFFINEVMVSLSYPKPHYFYIHINSSIKR